MKKGMLVLVMCLFFFGCRGKNLQNENVSKIAEDKKNTSSEKKEFKKSVENLKAIEKIGEVMISWDLNDTENVSEIMIDMRRGAKRKIVRIPSDQTYYVYKGLPLKKVTFSVIPISFDDQKGKETEVEAVPRLQHVLIKTNEYIDIDSNKVKLLFKTNYGSEVNLYVGNTQNDLKLVKSIKNYDFRTDRAVLEGLESNNTYYYQIESINGESKITSPIELFKKQEIPVIVKNEWGKTAIFYEIFVRSFYDGDGNGIGDFKGLESKLDYLKDLGIDAIWLMPMLKSDTYHGYDIIDYYNVEDDYGTMEDFEKLLATAHEKGIKIIIDLVVNHTSDDMLWMKEAKKSKENLYRNYYVWEDEFSDLDRIGEWGQEVWYYNDAGDNYYALFWSKMPDLNFRNSYVRQEIKKIAEFWIDKGVDGFRLDAAKHIDDDDMEVSLAWWKEFASFVKSKKRDAFLVGEIWTEDIEFLSKFYESLDSAFNFKLSLELENIINGEKVNLIKKLNKDHIEFEKYSKEYVDSIFVRNHDMERIASTFKGDIQKLKLVSSLLLTLPGTPFLYYGEELGQAGKKPDENIREPFDWYKSATGQGMTTMEKGGFFGSMRYTKANDGISLEEQLSDEKSLYNHYKKLINIRKDNSYMAYGNYEEIETQEGVYAYKIVDKGNLMIVMHNLSNESKVVKFKSDNIEKFFDLMQDKFLTQDEIVLNAYETSIIKYVR